jgi:uroporphyrinogen-III synthase
MARHLEELKPALRLGAKLAYVVGDQASYFKIPIRTGEILREIAHHAGYEVIRIDLFRTRFSTATKEQLREEVLILKWNG